MNLEPQWIWDELVDFIRDVPQAFPTGEKSWSLALVAFFFHAMQKQTSKAGWRASSSNATGRLSRPCREQGKNPFGRRVFQNLQYSDTPTQPLVPIQFTVSTADAAKKHAYRVIAVNTAGLKSKPSAKATPGT